MSGKSATGMRASASRVLSTKAPSAMAFLTRTLDSERACARAPKPPGSLCLKR